MGAKGLGSRAIIGEFYARLEQNIGTEWIDKLSMPFQSDMESETYKWLGMSPAMREWIGGRQAKGFRENGITIINKKFEATLEVLVDELRRDKTGQILVRIREMADRANAHWASLLSTLILNGATGVCYDGDYFFGDAHSEGDSGTQDNNISADISEYPAVKHGVITAPSAEEMEFAILDGIKQIIGFKDDRGEPMNENANQFSVMVPPVLYPAGVGAVKSMTLGNSDSILKATGFNISIVPNVRLATWTVSFAVFRTDGQVKPFVRQEELPIQIDAIAEGSELEFNEDKHHYGIKTSRNVGYGYWQHSCYVTLA